MATMLETVVDCATGKSVQREVEDARASRVIRAVTVSGPAGRAIMQFHGLEAAILNYIAAIPDAKTRLLAKNGYLSAATFARDDTLLNAVFTGMGKTDAEVDVYFVEADELSRTV